MLLIDLINYKIHCLIASAFPNYLLSFLFLRWRLLGFSSTGFSSLTGSTLTSSTGASSTASNPTSSRSSFLTILPILRFYKNDKPLKTYVIAPQNDLNLSVSETASKAKEIYKSKVLNEATV